MQSRRDFIKEAALLSSAAGIFAAIPASLARALAIDPAPGSTFLDAEHIVILMQENRSFDHAFGTLRGVRGYGDPRAITLPDGNPVWIQTSPAGERFVPFRFDIKGSKSTWMGCLPHSWHDQVDARNDGKYDRWLHVKQSGEDAYASMPLTLGHYTRQDIPFYYALADAFTICDQHFCSCLTGTTPNRLHLWTGTIRAEQSASAPPLLRNGDCEYLQWVSWTTFPERLEDHGVSWKIYQNELNIPSGLDGEADSWLTNFGDNPIEWFTQYNARFAATHRSHRDERVRAIPGEIESLRSRLAAHEAAAAPDAKAIAKLRKQIAELTATLARFQSEQPIWSQQNFDTLPARDKSLHTRAFCTNTGDPDYRELIEITYQENGAQRRLKVPKGDLFHQFRKDVESGTLPTVSWMVAPQKLSDHPDSAWYGAWYIAQALDILTKNPAVWKKTIFILTYDENDGYFDHVPPFVCPRPGHPETGRVSAGIDAALEHVELEQDLKRASARYARGGPIGLGYRVPMVIASPWSRGGAVCSQVFDHTSVLQFLEKFIAHKTGRAIKETNINTWRRAVCGDLTSAFRPSPDSGNASIAFPPRDAFIEEIHRAQYTSLPTGFAPLTDDQVHRLRQNPVAAGLMPLQEAGTRPSCPLPYELGAEGSLSADRSHVVIRMEARRKHFGDRAAGAPFTVYALNTNVEVPIRNYAVEPGASVEDSWPIDAFVDRRYYLRVHGPNGFFREFTGDAGSPDITIELREAAAAPGALELSGDVEIHTTSRHTAGSVTIEVRDNAYGDPPQSRSLPPGGSAVLAINSNRHGGWYDLTIRATGPGALAIRYSGRVETGRWSTSDPAIGTPSG